MGAGDAVWDEWRFGGLRVNEFHRRSIAAAFHHIDGSFSRIEAILNSIGAKSPFSSYAFDVGPMEQSAIAGYLQRLRERMWAATHRLEIPPENRRISAAWSIRTTLLDVSITLAEIEPRRLLGYGELDESSATVLSGILSDLERLLDSLDAYLTRVSGGDMAERMARLETTPSDREALTRVEDVITRHGLVELRPPLDAILSRLESRDLEIAVFGRVSCGKSSLLNYLLGEAILPVGVLPVTAVLTRLRRTANREAIVRSEIGQPRSIALGEVAAFVTEEGNPRNTRRIVDVTIGIPSERLTEGVTLIDTPGVGSLATVGAAQTKAYLPRCDLGVLLIDAGSILDHEDLALLTAMNEAAVPSMVLISKCDLLSEKDRERIVEYVKRQTHEILGTAASVDLVSTRDADAALTDKWFEERIKPIMLRHREELERSVRRKIGNLVESALSFLSVHLERLRVGPGATNEANDDEARKILREAEGRTASVAALLTKPLEEGITKAIEEVIEQASAEVVLRSRRRQPAETVPKDLVARLLAAEAEETRVRMEDLSGVLTDTAQRLPSLLAMPAIRLDEDPQQILDPLPPADEPSLTALQGPTNSPLYALWRAAAVRSAQRKMRSQYAARMWSVVRDHRLKLRSWTERNLRHVTNAFEARVAVYRAKLDASAEDEEPARMQEKLQLDMALLRGLLGTPNELETPQPSVTL